MVEITEPATLLTDYLLAAFTAVLGGCLLARSSSAPARLWAAAFFATAVGGLTGGTFHGFRTSLGEPAAGVLWLVTMYAIGAASCAMLVAVVTATLRGATARRWLVLAAWAKLAIYLAWVTMDPEFRFAIYDYGVSMATMVILEVVAPGRGVSRSGRWIVAGIMVSVVAAMVQQSGWDLHQHFNHNDLFHVIQAGAVWLLYRGALAAVTPGSVSRSSAAAG